MYGQKFSPDEWTTLTNEQRSRSHTEKSSDEQKKRQPGLKEGEVDWKKYLDKQS